MAACQADDLTLQFSTLLLPPVWWAAPAFNGKSVPPLQFANTCMLRRISKVKLGQYMRQLSKVMHVAVK